MNRTVPPVDVPLRVLAWPAFKTKIGNPYNWLLYSHMAAQGVGVDEFGLGKLIRGNYDILHVHWPEWQISHPGLFIALLRFLRLFLILGVARLRGIRIVWTVHNLYLHEKYHPRLGDWFYRLFIPFVDGYISLTVANVPQIRERFPLLRSRPHEVIPIGHYRGIYPDGVTKEEARAHLGIAAGTRVILYFGHIRPYKNVTPLVKEFRMSEWPDCILLVAGKPMTPELEAEIRQAGTGDPRIRLTLDFVKEEDVQLFFRAADFVALPFQEITNSSSAILALSFDRPVLVPAASSLVELQGMMGDAWVKTYTGDLALETLERGIEWATLAGRPAEAPLDRIGWDTIASRTKEFFLRMRKI